MVAPLVDATFEDFRQILLGLLRDRRNPEIIQNQQFGADQPGVQLGHGPIYMRNAKLFEVRVGADIAGRELDVDRGHADRIAELGLAGFGGTGDAGLTKALKGQDGDLPMTVPRSFWPELVRRGGPDRRHGVRRIRKHSQVTVFPTSKIISLYAARPRVRDIKAHLLDLYGLKVSPTRSAASPVPFWTGPRMAGPGAGPHACHRSLRHPTGEYP